MELYRLPSAKTHQQEFNNCYAHSSVRCFIRTLQVLDVIPDKFIYHFYKVFVIILTRHFGCDDEEPHLVIKGEVDENPVRSQSSRYLLEYLKNDGNIEDLFSIKDDGNGLNLLCEDVCILATVENKGPSILGSVPISPGAPTFTEHDKQHFIERLKKVLPFIIIIEEKYYFYNYDKKTSVAYPTPLMIDSLEKSLQPEIDIGLPIDRTNLNKAVIGDCQPDTAHGVTLKSWKKKTDKKGKKIPKNGSIFFRNSWGEGRDFEKPTSDLAYLTCLNENQKMKSVVISYVTFTDDVYDIDFLAGGKTRSNKKKGLKERLEFLHKKHPLTNFTMDEVRNKMNGEVDLYYNYREPEEGDYLISKQLVDTLHMSRALFTGDDNLMKQSYKNYELFTGLLDEYGEEAANNQDENGNTPLMNVFSNVIDVLAVDIVKQLLDAGADPYIQNENNENAFHYNLKYSDETTAEEIGELLSDSNGGRRKTSRKTKRKSYKKRITRKRKPKKYL